MPCKMKGPSYDRPPAPSPTIHAPITKEERRNDIEACLALSHYKRAMASVVNMQDDTGIGGYLHMLRCKKRLDNALVKLGVDPETGEKVG